MEIAEREGRNIEECGCSRNRRPLIHNTPDIGVNPINGLLTIVRTIETERIKRKEEESGKRQAGTGTGEKFTSAEEGEDDIMKNRWESMRGKRDEKREKDRREERSLFVWKEDLKHVVPLYTRIVRGSRLGKIKKKPSIGGTETVEESDGAPVRGKRMTCRERRGTETKEDGRRTRASSRPAGREGERHPLPAARVLYCFCVRSKWEGDGGWRVSEDGGASERTAIGYWKSVFL